jgi:hypothetical protein
VDVPYWLLFSPSLEDRSPAPSRGSSVASYADAVLAKGKSPLVEDPSSPGRRPLGHDGVGPSSLLARSPMRSLA